MPSRAEILRTSSLTPAVIRPTLRCALPAALLLVLAVLTGCSGGSTPPPPPPPTTQAPIPHETTGLTATAADGRGAIRPLPPLTGCTATASDPASVKHVLQKAKPGDRLCITGDLSSYRMRVIFSGVPGAPIYVLGDGQTKVNGIDINASDVVVDGFTVLNAKSPEVEIEGNDVTFQNNVVRNPITPSYDNLYFFGDNIKILHNTLGHNSGSTTAQPNCIETFSADLGSPPSHHALIDSNRCENTINNCLQARGPNSPGGAGQGASTDITYNNNYCQTRGQAAVVFDDVQNATITNNVVAQINHAWALQNHATGAKISGNTIAPGTGYEVGMDESSRAGYQGPPSGGTP